MTAAAILVDGRQEFVIVEETKNLVLKGVVKMVRRSDLYLPSNNTHMIQKATTLGADVISLDLEDSVAPAEKVGARKILVENIPLAGSTGSRVWTRINAWDSDLTLGDLDAVVTEGIDGILLPKCNGLADVRRIDDEITKREKAKGLPVGKIKLALLIETAIGVMKVNESAGGSGRLEALIFGAVDYLRDMHTVRTASAMEQYHARAAIGVAARTYGLVAEDAPYGNFKDADGFKLDSERSAMLGFEGKMLIHPSQVAVANAVYAPAPDRVEWAKAITKCFEEEGLAKGKASVAYQGNMIDIPVYNDGRNILARQAEIDAAEAKKAH